MAAKVISKTKIRQAGPLISVVLHKTYCAAKEYLVMYRSGQDRYVVFYQYGSISVLVLF